MDNITKINGHMCWKRICSLCGKTQDWCRHEKSNFKVLGGICPDCVKKAGEKKEDKPRILLPLKTKEFFLKVGEIFFYYVDELEIESMFTDEFNEAGNYMRYLFIPLNEVWVTITLNFQNVILACWHEFTEIQLMKLGLDYDPAHLMCQHLDDFSRGNLAGASGTDEYNLLNILNDAGLGGFTNFEKKEYSLQIETEMNRLNIERDCSFEIEEGKPFSGQFSCRLKDPGKYDTFRRENNAGKVGGKPIDFIYGIKNGKAEIQSIRYKKKYWTEAEAKKHCESKTHISFE